MNMAIAETIRGLIADNLGVDIEDVQPDSTLTDLGMDSLDCIEIVMAAEEDFGIEISDDATRQIERVADAITCVEKYLAEKASGEVANAD